MGLNLGHRPPFKSKGYWLYAKEKDVLHLSSSKDSIKNMINVQRMNTFKNLLKYQKQSMKFAVDFCNTKIK